MSKYLDPKADLTFKKVFGDHPDLAISFLNAMLPFENEYDYITSIEYLPTELVPNSPLQKNSIVDVRCKDTLGRQFIVEMQMFWSQEFKYRVLFNASKAYIKQLDRAYSYSGLQPVYSLNLVNEIFETDSDNYYHDYKIVETGHPANVMEGLRFVFVELPKFKPHTYSEKKMQVLWLRYLTEIDENTQSVSEELMENSDIRKAVEQLEESAFSPAQMDAYDKFWDFVRTEKTLFDNAERRGLARGMERGMAQGIAQGMEKGMAQGMEKGRAEGEKRRAIKIASALKKAGFDAAFIASSTELTIEEIEKI